MKLGLESTKLQIIIKKNSRENIIFKVKIPTMFLFLSFLKISYALQFPLCISE